MTKDAEPKKELILDSSLQSYFYDSLQAVNQKSTLPLPNETIYYSSMVMDRFGQSQEYFEESDGKLREKILGTKLLEASQMKSKGAQKRAFKDIGDTALLLCGYFSDSLNKKLVDDRFYREVGQIAYRRLNTIVPNVYEIPSFFNNISKSFDSITMMIDLVAKQINSRSQQMNDEPLLLFVSEAKIKIS